MRTVDFRESTPSPAQAPPQRAPSDGADAPEGPGRRIRCPRCEWQPRRSSRWYCRCGTSWNTFDTGGRCPGCAHLWQHTACLNCGGWSAHLAWYAPPDPRRFG